MQCFSWNGLGGYDRFLKVDESERQAIIGHYGTPEAAGWGWGDGFYFYLLCDEKRVITPLKMPSLAFGGQYNGDSPYGEETSCRFSLKTISEYRLEMNWQAPK